MWRRRQKCRVHEMARHRSGCLCPTPAWSRHPSDSPHSSVPRHHFLRESLLPRVLLHELPGPMIHLRPPSRQMGPFHQVGFRSANHPRENRERGKYPLTKRCLVWVTRSDSAVSWGPNQPVPRCRRQQLRPQSNHPEQSPCPNSRLEPTRLPESHLRPDWRRGSQWVAIAAVSEWVAK